MQRFNATEQALIDMWEAHTAAEFEYKDADAAIAIMTEHPVLIHVPVGTGATGREALRKFYREIFIPQIPPDVELQLLTRSVTQYRIIDKFILRSRTTQSRRCALLQGIALKLKYQDFGSMPPP
jgi:carboxymethylenebutenolidase